MDKRGNVETTTPSTLVLLRQPPLVSFDCSSVNPLRKNDDAPKDLQLTSGGTNTRGKILASFSTRAKTSSSPIFLFFPLPPPFFSATISLKVKFILLLKLIFYKIPNSPRQCPRLEPRTKPDHQPQKRPHPRPWRIKCLYFLIEKNRRKTPCPYP